MKIISKNEHRRLTMAGIARWAGTWQTELKSYSVYGVLAAGLALAGCATKPTAVALVGPEPGGRATAHAKGALQVFSATQQSNPIGDIGPNSYFYPHTGYEIYDQSGHQVKFVPNHASDMDEWPDQVDLSAGKYNIVAESSRCGLVTVPVMIEPGKITNVHLDGNWWPPSHASTKPVVWLPDGEGVGWSGSIAESGR